MKPKVGEVWFDAVDQMVCVVREVIAGRILQLEIGYPFIKVIRAGATKLGTL